MPTTSIKISQLDPIASLTGSDFFPIDQSSSIKTYRASLTQLQNLFSTGSFTGSVIGTIVGTGTSPQFVGTSSWANNALSSNSSISGAFSNSSSYALSSSNALTASYALNANAGDIEQLGSSLADISVKINNLSVSFNKTASSVSLDQFSKIFDYLKIYISVLHAMFILIGFSIIFLNAKEDTKK